MPGIATIVRLDVEADPKAIRSETVRAIRGLVKLPEPTMERPSGPTPQGVLRGLVGIFRDLEQSLAAISQSLAESVDSTTSGRRTSP